MARSFMDESDPEDLPFQEEEPDDLMFPGLPDADDNLFSEAFMEPPSESEAIEGSVPNPGNPIAPRLPVCSIQH